MAAPGEFTRNIDWWLVLVAGALCAIGVLFIHSATLDDDAFGRLPARQTIFLLIGSLVGVGVAVVPYPRIMRLTWFAYGVAIVSLALLPWFGSIINGARRWYSILGIGVQPSEFAKLAVVLVLAAWLRFRSKARTGEGLVVPLVLTAVPVALIFNQPDLGSSLVFWPVLIAMCYVAGTPGRTLLGLMALGVLVLLVMYATMFHDYQRLRVEVWMEHFGWDRAAIDHDPAVAELLRGPAFQPWQALIAIGGGGLTGFGYAQGPQNRFSFLPYDSGDYVFAVVAEELGWLGAVGVLVLVLLLCGLILAIAGRTRERFGRLVCVGVATWIGTQALLHVAVCCWLVPSTGLPMPFLSYGGSSALVVLVAVALVVNIGARREPVLAADGFE